MSSNEHPNYNHPTVWKIIKELDAEYLWYIRQTLYTDMSHKEPNALKKIKKTKTISFIVWLTTNFRYTL